MRRRSLPILLLAPMALAQSQPTFYAAYQDGLDAEHRGDWAAAAGAYQRAIALRPVPAARVIIYGNNLLTNYYPYTRLARCQLELGRLEGAHASLLQATERREPASERQRLQQHLEAAQAAAAPPRPTPRTPSEDAPPQPAPREAAPPPAPVPPVSSPTPDVQAAPQPAPEDMTPPTRAFEPETPREAAPPAGRPAAGAPGVPEPSSPPSPAGGGSRWWPWLVGGAAALVAGLAWGLGRRGRSGAAPEKGFGEPERVGPYRIERLLGRGGFASTYLARHEDTQQAVALKVLHPYRQDDEEFLRRFRQEARLGALLDHPKLVRILDPGPDEGTPYLAMEHVKGCSLEERLKRQGALPLAEACAIGRDVAEAMAYAHAHGVVHRDLKPGNILLTEAGARVTDLGIARVMDAATVTTTYAFLGTPLYAAPESQLKTHVGPAADRYSLGVILFHLLAGEPPFQGETPFQILDRHRAAVPPDLATLRPDVPPHLAALVMGLLAKDPDQRPDDAAIVQILSEEAGSGSAAG